MSLPLLGDQHEVHLPIALRLLALDVPSAPETVQAARDSGHANPRPTQVLMGCDTKDGSNGRSVAQNP